MNPKNRFTKQLAVIVLSLLGIANVHAAVSINYVVNNHLGAPVLLVDENQHVVWQAEYDEFGKATILVEEVEFNVRFPGQYYDKETGLNYNYYRDYNQDLGRYVQSDPIGLAGGINTYGYVGGNPVSYIDSTGENAIALRMAWSGGQAVGGAIYPNIAVPLGGFIDSVANADQKESDVSSEWVDNVDAKADHDDYKDDCNEQEPPGLSLCESYKFRLNRAEACKAGMESWDKKWSPSGSRHANAIAERQREINTLERKIKRNCQNECE